ncbi:MAG TPA: hypothetical protein VJR58_21975 [Vineibacter sp.]|nr:hypothetical protein [Vineibacter sp.]
MFKECQIKVTQKLRGYQERWLYVRLLEARIPVMGDGEFYEYAARHGQRIRTFTFWGKWRTGPNSITPTTATDAYSIGGSNLSAPKLWVYSAGSQTLAFLDLDEKGPRQLGHSNNPEDMKVSLNLYNAEMTARGITPLRATAPDAANGHCLSSTLFQHGPIQWSPDATNLGRY